MGVILFIVIVVVILVVYSNNKEKERQEERRRDEAYRRRREAEQIRWDYAEGYRAWKKQNYPHSYIGLRAYETTISETEINEILAHKSEIKKLHYKIQEGYREEARKDEQFATEQKAYNDKCRDLSKKFLVNEGRYHYDIGWKKRTASGGWSKDTLMVWQFFPGALCHNKELDYSLRPSEKENADNLPQFKDMTRYWHSSVYDRINTFISEVAKLSYRPLLVVLVDTKPEWKTEALEYHLKNIKRDIANTIVSPLSQIRTKIDGIGKHLEHILVVDAYTENAQLVSICEELEELFSPAHAAISYISLLKCYDNDEMVLVLEQEKEEEIKRALRKQADSIKQANPNGYERWHFSLELNGFKGEVSDQMIIDAKDIITKHQLQFEEDGVSVIEKVKIAVSDWNHLTPTFTYKYLLRYYPTTCEFEATDEEWDDRYIVWNFKNDPTKVSQESHSQAMTWVIQNTETMLFNTLGREAIKYLTLVCIPASSIARTESRYKEFSEKLCKDTGMANAYTHITVSQEVVPKNQGGTGMPSLEFDTDYFKNRNVIIFDDIITKGLSMLRMKQLLEHLGATVIAGISIGKTFHHRPDE